MTDTIERGDNPRAVIGGNAAPLAEQMALHYESLTADADAAALAAAKLPCPVTSADDVKLYADHARVIKGVTTRIAAAEEKEKRPLMNAIDAVRGYFGQMHNKNGSGQLDAILNAMRGEVKKWQDAEAARVRAAAAAEAERLRQEEAARIKAAQEEAQRLAREEAQRREAERQAIAANEPAPAPGPAPAGRAAHVQEHLHQADVAGHGARMADKTATASNADLTRVRSAIGGGMATSTTFWTFEVQDLAAIPPASLWPFITDAEKVKAVSAFVKAHKGGQELPGVRIFQDTRTDWR